MRQRPDSEERRRDRGARSGQHPTLPCRGGRMRARDGEAGCGAGAVDAIANPGSGNCAAVLLRSIPYDAHGGLSDGRRIPASGDLPTAQAFLDFLLRSDSRGTRPVGMGGRERQSHHQRQSGGRAGLSERSHRNTLRCASALAVPLIHERGIVGVLSLYRRNS